MDNCLTILASNNLPVVVDLFSGCGGLALGFHEAGFDIVYGADIQKDACDTANYNLAWKYGKETTHFCEDIINLDIDKIQKYISGREVIVIGGPPCQAYSSAGKGKLRSLGEDRVNTKDRRGYLFQDFIRIALALNASAIVMENVPDAANYGEINVPETVCNILEKHKYKTQWSILNATNYGVPQNRERIILVAVRGDRNGEFEYPIPPLKDISFVESSGRNKIYAECEHFVKAPRPINGCMDRITIREAISDLPVLMADSTCRYRSIALNIALPYKTKAEYDYQIIMRRNCQYNSVTANSFRNNSRDFKTFERMKPGDNYVDACKIAEERLDETCKALNIAQTPNNPEYLKLVKEIIPPYERDAFVEKWRRLDPNKPCPTVVAHMSKDTYAFIHPWEPRGLSVRESARMQSFPDDFQFMGSMGEAFKQIGNAVPPLLSNAIARALKKTLVEEDESCF